MLQALRENQKKRRAALTQIKESGQHHFAQMKLLHKLVLIIVLTVFVILTADLLIRELSYRVYDEQQYLKSAQVLTSYVNQLEVELDKVDSLSLSMIGDEAIQSNLQQLKYETNVMARIDCRRNLSYRIANYASLLSHYKMFGVGCLDNMFISTNMSSLTIEQLGRYSELAGEAEGALRLVSENGNVFAIRQIRQIQPLTLDRLGAIVIELDLSSLISSLNDNYESVGIVPQIFIFDEKSCLYQSDILLPNQFAEDGWRIVDDQFIVQCSSKQLGWKFLVTIPYRDVMDVTQKANAYTMLLSVCVGLTAILICSAILYSITKHFDVLLAKFDDFSRGILPDEEASAIYQHRFDEIGELHRQFETMAKANQLLTDKHYNSMLLLKDARFKQLQNQMSPHFLFNTLSTVIWMAYEHQDDETAIVTEKLCNLLQCSIRNNETQTTLREETSIVQDYIYIQRVRFGERLQIDVNIPEDMLELLIPPMTLQPIVENVIVHVMEKTVDQCQIRVSGFIDGDHAIILVEDNGNDLDEDILALLESGKKVAKGNGVGLSNINSRIQMMFGEPYGLMFSRANGYSCVKVRIPCKRSEGQGGTL